MAVADSEFFYGIANDKLVAGDWDGNGDDTVGVYRPSDGNFYVKLNNTQGVADVTIPVVHRGRGARSLDA